MTYITLNAEQAEALAGASCPVVFVDSDGRKLGEIASLESKPRVQAPTEEEWIAEGVRRAEESRHFKGELPTTQEVLAKLRGMKPE